MTKARDIANSTSTLDVEGGTIKLDGNHPVGSANVALGELALDSNVSGGSNTAIGRESLTNNTASNNTAVGKHSLRLNSSGTSNVAVGKDALTNNTTASNNTAVGYQAGYNGTTAFNNAYFGIQAGYSTTTAQQNTFLGRNSGYHVTTGGKNTILGCYTGNQGGLDIRTSSNNIVLSDGDGNPLGYRKSSDGTWVFNNSTNAQNAVTVSNTGTGGNPYGLGIYYPNAAPNNDSGRFLTCLDSSAIRLKIFNNGNVVNQNNSYGADSDIKLKENITDASSQWDDIKALTVRKYSMKADELDAPNMLGVIAQEVEAAGMNGLVKEIADIDKEMNDLGTTTKSVNYSILYMKAVKALQEAMTRIETLETKVTALEGA